MFRLFKKKPFFTAPQQESIVAAIRMAEQQTSGEIRVYVESRNRMVDPVDRAKEIFYELKMQHTEHHNGVLLYIAVADREMALYGDEGIYKATGQSWWQNAVKQLTDQFKTNELVPGMIQCIHQIGQVLKAAFPYEKSTDKNELPDEIVFGQ